MDRLCAKSRRSRRVHASTVLMAGGHGHSTADSPYSLRRSSMTYKIMGWAAVVVLSVALSTAAVTPSAQAADNGKTVASAPRLVLKLSGMSFADGSKVRAATVTTRAGARVP